MITSPKLSTLVASLVVAVAGMGSAHALSVTAGNYKISFDNYDSGTTGYGDFASGTFTQVCTSVAGCDAVTGLSKAPGSVGSVNTSADTMGIISVSNITNVTTGATEYIKGSTSTVGGVVFGPFLTGIFGNLMDANVLVSCPPGGGACTTDARSISGQFRLWSNTSDYNPLTGPTVSAGVDLNNARYTGINPGGALFLSGNFAAGGAVAGDLVTTYASNFNNNSISGLGFGALDFTGGSALSFFNTNSYTNVNGGLNDAYLTASFNPSAAAPNWTVISTGQVIGAVSVPEPGSLLLVSLALLSMGAVTRRAVKR